MLGNPAIAQVDWQEPIRDAGRVTPAPSSGGPEVLRGPIVQPVRGPGGDEQLRDRSDDFFENPFGDPSVLRSPPAIANSDQQIEAGAAEPPLIDSGMANQLRDNLEYEQLDPPAPDPDFFSGDDFAEDTFRADDQGFGDVDDQGFGDDQGFASESFASENFGDQNDFPSGDRPLQDDKTRLLPAPRTGGDAATDRRDPFERPRTSDEESFREILRSNEPEHDLVPAPSQDLVIQQTEPTVPVEPIDDAPQTSPSDVDRGSAFDNLQDTQVDNPFIKRDFDRRDLERLNQSRGNQNGRQTLGSNIKAAEVGPSCDEIRRRISEQTIDQISLDISPPYRPDEIDLENYQQLKQEFEERQLPRDWRGVNGQVIANGSLYDLAYENVIIVTQDGKKESIPLERISEADLAYVAENWGVPQECRLAQVAPVPRDWEPQTMTYLASNLCHNPLYFEDVNLERYGHTHGPVLEPFVQSAHFFGNCLILPYKMGVHCPNECQYALGYYRPGDCAPWIKPPIPISLKGALAQTATMTALFWLIP